MISTVALSFSWAFLGFMLPISIAGANIGWALTAIAVLLAWASDQVVPWRRHRSAIETPLLFYVVAAGLACALGIEPRLGAAAWLKEAYKVWVYLLCSVGSALLLDQGEWAWLGTLGAMGAGFAVSALIGIGQPIWSQLQHGRWTRAHAFVHPVTFGEQMAIAALGAFCFFEFSSSKNKARMPALGVLILTSVALFLSQTRGAILSAAAGFFAIAVFSPPKRWRAAAAGAAASLAAVASDLLPTGRSLLESLAAYRDAANPQLARWTLWRAAWRMFIDHPWFGVGLNNYREQFGKYYSITIDGETAMGNAHNLYLHQLAERGIVGAAALAWLLFALTRRSVTRARGNADATQLWALGATVAFLVMNVTEIALQVEQVWMLFFFIWICSEQHSRSGQSPKESR